MLTLVPRDHWEHRLTDMVRGFGAAFGMREKHEVLRISELGGCIPVRSGRAALVAAIRALKLRPGAGIGVPLYCCPVVFRAIEAAGCTARFIEIEPETFCISTEDLYLKRAQVDAVVAVHMFGNVCDMPGVQAAAQGKPVVEDCALSLGSRIEGRMAGSFGAVSFFSFRSGKYLSVGEGGALFSNDPDLRRRISQEIASMPGTSCTEDCAHVATTYIKSLLRSKPLYGLAGYSLWAVLNKRMNLSEKSGITMSQIYRSDLAIASRRLVLLKHAIETQRANADFYSRTLRLDSKMLCWEKPGAFYNRYQFPITFPSSEERDSVASYLLGQRIDTTKYVDNVAEVAAKYYGYAGECPVTEGLIKRVLIIPSYYSLRNRELERIADCLNTGWMRARRRAQGRNGN